MEFECSEMTYLGCEKMNYVKELMLANREEILCKNMCCINCENANLCGYLCERSRLSKEKRLTPIRDSEEIQMERLLGIRCYNCKKVINQEGHRLNVFSSEVECVYLCEDCFKKVIGDQSKYKKEIEYK